MTVYTTMPGGDAGHTQAAASPPEGRGRNRPAANLQQSRRQGAVPSESPTSAVPGEQGLRPWQPSQPMRARRKPRTAAELRRAASSRPVHESAVLCLHGSQSHRWHVVRRTHHHPRHHQSTQGYRCGVDDRTHVHISAPNKQEAPTQRRGGQGDDPTDRICRGAPSYIIDIYAYAPRISSGPTPRTGYLSDSLTLIPTLRQGSSCRAGRPPP